MAQPHTHPEEELDPTALAEDVLEPPTMAPPVDRSAEEAAARRLADRYRLEFLDMNEFRIDQ